MPRKLPRKNSSWIQLTKDFVKEWPEILEGLQFRNLPVKYLLYCNIILKNNITIHYDIKKALKSGVQLGDAYSPPCHKQPVFEKYSSNFEFNVADSILKKHISLPMYVDLNDNDIELIINKIKELLNNGDEE